jgi:peptidoglycan/LPS O-acetylase OafA/YrhL
MTTALAESSLQAAPAGQRRHIPALDGIRGLAILLVMMHHLWVRQLMGVGLLGASLDRLANLGWLGVDLFFVLSGFLITGVLLDAREKPHYFRNFYIRRSLRIFPLYFGVLIPATALCIAFPPDAGFFKGIGSLWTYLGNIEVTSANKWNLQSSFLNFNPFWSLAVEEHFYLVWPAIVLLLPRKGLVAVSAAALALAAVSKFTLWHMGLGQVGGYAFTLCRTDSLAIGALACCVHRAGNVRWVPLLLLATSLLFIALAWNRPLLSDFYIAQMLATPLAAVISGCLLILAARPGIVAYLFESTLLRKLGKYSYGIYVFHFLFFPLSLRVANDHPSLQGLYGDARRSMMLGITGIVLAVASYHLYEVQFLKLKSRFK